MPHHRNLGLDELRDEFDPALAAFDFHRFSAALFHQPHRIADGFLDRNVEAAVGHVRYQQRPTSSAPHRASVVQNVVDA